MREKSSTGGRRFEGKVAIVTGASDRGLGGAIAERLLREGASVLLASHLKPDRLLRRLSKLGQKIVWSDCDVCQAEDARQAVADCMAQFGRIDLLVNNAGVEVCQPLEDFAEEQWQEVLDVNLSGSIRFTRAVLPFLAAPGGVIVNIASALAAGGCFGFSVYSASKAGIVGFTQSLAWELAPRRIRVVCVAPALVETPMMMRQLRQRTDTVQQLEKEINDIHPLGMGSPHDVASAVAFLGSDDARWITGVALPLGWVPQYRLPAQQSGG